jgi:hypothetical protein
MQASMDLDTLHQTHLATMSPTQSFDYLLDCQEWLKTQDRTGWIKNFAPHLLITEPTQKPKKIRCSPTVRVFCPLPPCIECKSDEVINDVREGSVVCTACGLVQSIQGSVGENNGTATMSVDQMMNGSRYIVHRYSRVVYFRSFLLGIQGQTCPEVDANHLLMMRVLCAGYSVVDPSVVNKILRQLKIAKRYRRHRVSLALKLSNGKYKPQQIPGALFMDFLTHFRKIEYMWDHGGKSNMKERKVFLSYPYIFYQLCVHMDCMHLTGKHHLLKSTVLLNKLHLCYGRLAKKVNLKCNLDVHH